MKAPAADTATPLGVTGAWLNSRSRAECREGSVLFFTSPHAFQAPGGGENQLVQTGRHLEAIGIPVRLFSPWTDRVEMGRLLHLFGMSREGLELARVAKARGVPVVLSPIFWYEPRAIAALERDPLRKLASLGAWGLRRLVSNTPSWRRKLLAVADQILPNSRSEAAQLIRFFGVREQRIQIVPNGVMPSFDGASAEPFLARNGLAPFVLFVGRIEPRKNPLGLIQAIRRIGLPLVVIGTAPPGHQSYEDDCRRAGGDRVTWLGHLDHHDPLLASAYAAARVFALPSWFETPGLAALEAALAGCSVVITPYGSTRDYFGELVEYARPDRPAEIERAVVRSWEDGPDPRLDRLIAREFVWPKVAQITAEVYDRVAG
jgi:glycosyltransferase involved in cell wall biosynthesis